MKLLILATFLLQIMSSMHEPALDYYQQIVKQHAKTYSLMIERLKIVDHQIHHIDALLHEKDCPSYLLIANATLHEDRILIKDALDGFKDLPLDPQ